MKRRRLALILAFGSLTAAAWGYLLHGAGTAPEMPDMPDMGSAWSAGHAGLAFAMWAAMMLAMMLPGAAPAIAARGAFFAIGYLVVWAGFGAGATALQWVLERAGALSPAALELRSAPLAALIVAGIGVYELTPLKTACLRYCRSDAALSVHGQGAGIGARIARGMQHGLQCVGCCWALMMLLFVGGVMNLVWVAALTLFVAAEKMLPPRLVLPRAAGLALILFGTVARLGFTS